MNTCFRSCVRVCVACFVFLGVVRACVLTIHYFPPSKHYFFFGTQLIVQTGALRNRPTVLTSSPHARYVQGIPLCKIHYHWWQNFFDYVIRVVWRTPLLVIRLLYIFYIYLSFFMKAIAQQVYSWLNPMTAHKKNQNQVLEYVAVIGGTAVLALAVGLLLGYLLAGRKGSSGYERIAH